MPDETPSVPILYVSDLTYSDFDPADLFDLAYLLRSPAHEVKGVCFTRPEGDGARVLSELAARANIPAPPLVAGSDLTDFLKNASESLNLVVVGGYEAVVATLKTDHAVFRQKVARLFVVGGHLNAYGANGTERLPTDPRLRQRHPERFASTGDERAQDKAALGQLLVCGEGVIWLARDIALWRYDAPGVLEDGGPLSTFVLRELFWQHLQSPDADRYEAAETPVLLSSLPAFLLAVEPDPFAWMRLFRVLAARVATNEAGDITDFATRTDAPNLYALIAIDGQALGKLLTANLRDRPLTV